MKYKKLFTYFGNKQYIANTVWKYFGQTDAYVEPFCGSAAVLLTSPYTHKYEAMNDVDCHIVNVFRSLRYKREETIQACYWPRTELDLHMRHDYLVLNKQRLSELLLSDVKACNPELAGWWIWGRNMWIGAKWCGIGGKCKPTDRNQGILTLRRKPTNRNRGFLTKPTAHSLGIINKESDRLSTITELITKVSNRLIDTNILYQDFSRVLTPSYTTNFGVTAVFMDPPYKDSIDYGIYSMEDALVWTRARDWFLKHMDDPLYRIILCGQDDDWPDVPDSVRIHTWTRTSGMTKDKSKNKTEKLYISKHCLDIDEEEDLSWAL